MRPQTISALLAASIAALAVALPVRADQRDRDLCVGSSDQAIAACGRVAASREENDTTRAEALVIRAGLLAQAGKNDQALADYAAAIKLKRDFAFAYYDRGVLLARIGKIDEAIADFDAAIKFKPDFSAAYNDRGTLWWNKGDRDRAMADYEMAVKLDPKDARAAFNRGAALAAKGDDKLAMADFDTAVKLDPAFVVALIGRGNLWAKLKEPRKAIVDYDAALGLEPGNLTALLNRGNQWDLERDHKRAIADFDAALKIDAKFVPALNGKAWTMLRAGQPSEALPHVNAALNIDPNTAYALDTRARIKEALGEYETALVDITRARSIDPNEREYRRTFVEVKAKLDEINRAKNGIELKAPAPLSENRMALVIGNSAYQNVPNLRNAENDARAMAEKFRDLGFRSVRLVNNMKREQLVAILDRFASEAAGADWAVVYFAGHGMEIGGSNWLMPVDASVKGGTDMQGQAVSLDQVITSVSKATKLRLVILDACRDNPFQPAASANAQGFARGLGRIEPANTTLVAYSAKHGQVALDGAGTNSPFVESLLKHMDTPGLEINRLFRRVADEVVNKTKRQEPFTYGRLPDDDFYFKPANDTAKAPSPVKFSKN
jgi:tetratricopeptide (TPR) repeat protein